MRYLLLTLVLIPTSVQMAEHISCYRILPVKQEKIDLKQEKCLATMIYGEARGEAELGQIAVAYSAVNRATKKTICQVVLAPKQYSIFNNNPSLKMAALSLHIEPKQKNKIDTESWKRATKVARNVLTNKVSDPTDGATHYISPMAMNYLGYKYPKWSYVYTRVAVIDNHVFYKKLDNPKVKSI